MSTAQKWLAASTPLKTGTIAFLYFTGEAFLSFAGAEGSILRLP
jgi:hypothetical protein